MIYFIAFLILSFFTCTYFFKTKKYSIIWYYYSIIFIYFFSSFRWENWTDWDPYYELFYMYNKFDAYYEPGYKIFNIIISYFTDSYTVYLLVVNLIIIVSFHRFIRYFLEDKFWILTIIPVYLIMLYSGGIRQFLAIALILNAILFYYKGKKILFGVCILLATSIHMSAIVAVIFPLIGCIKLKKKTMWKLVIVVSSIALLFLPYLKDALINLFEIVDFSESGLISNRALLYTSSSGIFSQQNKVYGIISIIRVSIPFIFLSLFIDFNKLYKQEKDRFILNYYFIGVLLSILFSDVTFVTMKRFYLYFKITEAFVLPILMKYSNKFKFQNIFILILYYFSNAIYIICFTYADLYTPYHAFWNYI